VATTTETQTVRAQAKWVRTSARKARLVAEHIRGRSVPEARAVLAFTPRAAARDMEKVLRSAVANAEANLGWNGEDLVVSAAYVDEGPTLKRWRARARGRVARIKKRTCHITLVLEQSPEAVATRRGRRSAAGDAEARRRIPTPRRRTKGEAPEPEAAVTEAAVVETEDALPAEQPAVEPAPPAEEAPAAEEAPVEEPEAAEAPKAEEPEAETPQAEPQPKPRRRPSVRRKKTDETEKES
jgi:large subunit ribosomal protein L22